MVHATSDNQSLPAIHNGATQPDSGESVPRCRNRIVLRKKRRNVTYCHRYGFNQRPASAR